MRMPSVMPASRSFSRVPQAKIQRSQFNRSHSYKTCFDAGLLIPIFVDEALPGDTFNLNLNAFARLSTPIKPLMDNLYLDTFFFAVPNRLVWANWERFCGAQDLPSSSTSYVIPQKPIPAAGIAIGDLGDYFGLPTDIVPTTTAWSVSALPYRAYYLIWNEWFRDQNMQESRNNNGSPGGRVTPDDGPDHWANPLLRRGKRHDYFTSCLPWPQKGDAVSLPLGTTVNVEPKGTKIPKWTHSNPAYTGRLQAKTAAVTADIRITGVGNPFAINEDLQWEDPELQVDLTTVTGATINALRQAFQIQKLLERDARGGTRYTEIVKSHFGVTSPDARLQRPEYLGGGSTPIMCSPIAQTSSTDVTTPQGNLSAIGTANINSHGFVKSFTEHCVILGLAAVRADLTYSQGIERMWSRETRYDFFWPALAQIGEQAVLNKEIYLQDHADDEAVFGYQERYAEYRYKPSRLTHLFRPTAAGTLRIWHLSERFTSLPTLGDTFIQDDPPIDEVIAVNTEPHIIFDGFFNFTAARPMPVFGIPGMIDHF